MALRIKAALHSLDCSKYDFLCFSLTSKNGIVWGSLLISRLRKCSANPPNTKCGSKPCSSTLWNVTKLPGTSFFWNLETREKKISRSSKLRFSAASVYFIFPLPKLTSMSKRERASRSPPSAFSAIK